MCKFKFYKSQTYVSYIVTHTHFVISLYLFRPWNWLDSLVIVSFNLALIQNFSSTEFLLRVRCSIFFLINEIADSSFPMADYVIRHLDGKKTRVNSMTLSAIGKLESAISLMRKNILYNLWHVVSCVSSVQFWIVTIISVL